MRRICCLFVLASLCLCSLPALSQRLLSQEFITPRSIANCAIRLGFDATDRTFTVAYLGGSITNMNGWRNKVDSFLQARYPSNKLRFINAGIPSLGSLPHAFRLQRDVLDSGRIDLLFLEAAVNDHVNGTDSLTQMCTLEGIVRHALRSNPYMDIVLMSFADPDKLKDYDEGITPTEISNHETVAAHYNLASINLAKEVHDRIKNREFTWEKDFKDLHPAPFGHQLYFETIYELWQMADKIALAYIGRTPRLTKHRLPAPLNTTAFDKGRYVPITEARPDTAWTINPDWTPTDGLNTRKGFVHVPMLTTVTAGATLNFSFKGTAIGIAIVSGQDAGIVEYSIDGAPFRQIDLFTQWSKSLHLPWYVLFDGNLPRRKHKLVLRVANTHNVNSTGNACRIVHFLVNE
ncbi:SGNH/GDSL hydrolase family protein [Paraflavitalea pollutisoli]|uniref:SGNH/GDSL hydrolase family protein n=1 Tax=Paraflavitalea pollutisoli TaxID=3034143 RepID=UPI0023EC309B|nr:SGNH/GDSL hydrolase family protein [Paraflavitalea sp. H1-2-19X]